MTCKACGSTGLVRLPDDARTMFDRFAHPSTMPLAVCGADDCPEGRRLADVLRAIAKGEPVGLNDTGAAGFEKPVSGPGQWLASGVITPVPAVRPGGGLQERRAGPPGLRGQLEGAVKLAAGRPAALRSWRPAARRRGRCWRWGGGLRWRPRRRAAREGGPRAG